MTAPVEGRAICDDREARCRCHKPAGHVEAGDPVHECDPKRCTGAYSREGGTFQVVRLPFPVGDSEPWPDEGCPDCGQDTVTEDEDGMTRCTRCGWRE